MSKTLYVISIWLKSFIMVSIDSVLSKTSRKKKCPIFFACKSGQAKNAKRLNDKYRSLNPNQNLSKLPAGLFESKGSTANCLLNECYSKEKVLI